MSHQPAPCKSVARAETERRRRQHKEVGQRQADLSALTLRLIETDPPFLWSALSLSYSFNLAGESGGLNDTPLSYPCFFAPTAIDHAAKLPASKHYSKFAADRNRARRGAQSLLYAPHAHGASLLRISRGTGSNWGASQSLLRSEK